MSEKAPVGMKKEDWAGDRGDAWLANLPSFEGMIWPLSAAIVEAAAVKPGEAVLDVGCGGGATTMALAKSAAPTGTATGLDISQALAGETLRRCSTAGVSNVSVIVADATKAPLQSAAYDLVFSSFGVMFFDDPVAAFKNLRRALKPGGRLAFACWMSPKENPWNSLVTGVLAKHIVLPKPDPRAPGPFAFADPDYPREILNSAGFSNIAFNEWRGRIFVAGKGSTPSSAADFVLKAMSIGDLVRDLPESSQAAIRRDIEKVFSDFATKGGVEVDTASWFVHAGA
ncbi:MAG: methyltransferase domain-containing protein [Pseudomonadota bacterium]